MHIALLVPSPLKKIMPCHLLTCGNKILMHGHGLGKHGNEIIKSWSPLTIRMEQEN